MNMKLILAVVIVGFLFAGCDKKEATQSASGPSGTAKTTNNYENAGISFQYPISWHSAQSMTAMRTQLTDELRNFNRTLAAFDMFISPDEEVALLVSKVQTDNALSAVDILAERGKVYEDATRTGDVTKINKLETTTIKYLPAVVEDVERSNGGRGHTVKLLNGKYIVELSLIVNNKAKFEKHIGEYEEILASLKVQEEKAEIKATTSTEGIKKSMIGTWTSDHVSFKEFTFKADGTFQTISEDGSKISGNYILLINELRIPRQPTLLLKFSNGHVLTASIQAIAEKNLIFGFDEQIVSGTRK